MIELTNNDLTVQVNEMGAELTSVVNSDGIEFMWQADKTFWGRHAPVLFPIVGRLKADQYQYNGQNYSMAQHGFARNNRFLVVNQTSTTVTLELTANEATKVQFPFEFSLRITYTLDQHSLKVSYAVINQNSVEMPFSIGAHPGFNIPLVAEEANFTDYVLRVAPATNYQQIPLQAPLSDPANAQELNLRQPLALTHRLFEDDALILKLDGKETTVMLETAQNDHGVALTVANAPYLGIWSPYPKEAPFVCLEPWWGIADPVDTDGMLEHKLAMNHLAPQKQFTAQYSMTFF